MALRARYYARRYTLPRAAKAVAITRYDTLRDILMLMITRGARYIRLLRVAATSATVVIATLLLP